MAVPHATLVAWQRADDLFVEVHRVTLVSFPAHERYELGSQIRRAAYSAAAHLVEGYARRHIRDSLHFFNIAASSLAEVGCGLHAARRLGYIDAERFDALDVQVRRTAAPLHGLIGRLRSGHPLKAHEQSLKRRLPWQPSAPKP
jgi:four helix bundle protein